MIVWAILVFNGVLLAPSEATCRIGEDRAPVCETRRHAMCRGNSCGDVWMALWRNVSACAHGVSTCTPCTLSSATVHGSLEACNSTEGMRLHNHSADFACFADASSCFFIAQPDVMSSRFVEAQVIVAIG